MSSIAKTVLTLSAGIGIATSVALVKNRPETIGFPKIALSEPLSPIILSADGKIRFLGRIPPAAIASDIRMAAKSQNFDHLNDHLKKHNFYIIPESATPVKNL